MSKGRERRLSTHAGRNASERRAGLETAEVGADPPEIRGRPLLTGEPERESPGSPTGVVAMACMTGRSTETREAHAVRGVTLNRDPARGRPGRGGWRIGL